MKSAMLSRYFILLAAVILAGVGCKKIKTTRNSNTITVTSPNGTVVDPPQGGPGGNASLRITPVHEGLNIDSCMVYIKYDAAVVPANDVYDDSVWAKDDQGTPVATFSGLKPGNYYVFAEGWDLVRSLHVSGGLPFIVLEENKATIHSFVLPVDNFVE